MSRISILNRSIRTAIAGLLFVGLLSPAHAAVPTSHLPWLAPVGHRQPHQADVPQHEAVSAWERQQQQAERELDHRLIICRGC